MNGMKAHHDPRKVTLSMLSTVSRQQMQHEKSHLHSVHSLQPPISNMMPLGPPQPIHQPLPQQITFNVNDLILTQNLQKLPSLQRESEINDLAVPQNKVSANRVTTDRVSTDRVSTDRVPKISDLIPSQNIIPKLSGRPFVVHPNGSNQSNSKRTAAMKPLQIPSDLLMTPKQTTSSQKTKSSESTNQSICKF